MGITPNYDLDVDTSLGGNSASDYVISSQKAIKSYVDNNSGGNVKLDGGSTSQTIQLSSGTGTTPITLKSKSTGSCYVSYYANTTWVGSLGVNSSKRPSFYNGSSNTLAYTSELPTTFTGCDSITAGIAGLVPAPNAGDENKFLKANGTWATVSGGGTATDVQINGTSITSSNVANIITNSAYNASSNKIATMTDVPTVNNSTITIQKNGSTVESFTLNQASAETINITVPTTASDISAADINLSNLSATGKTVLSGQWVQSTQTIIENTSITNSNGTALQKTVTLPDDNYVYEVLFNGRVRTGTSSGNNLTLGVSSNVLTDNYSFICAAITRSSSYMGTRGNTIIPMKHGTNNLSIGRASNYNGTAWLYVLAYRRLGTNS